MNKVLMKIIRISLVYGFVVLYFVIIISYQVMASKTGLKQSSIDVSLKIYRNESYTIKQLDTLGVDIPPLGYMHHHYNHLKTRKFLQEIYLQY